VSRPLNSVASLVGLHVGQSAAGASAAGVDHSAGDDDSVHPGKGLNHEARDTLRATSARWLKAACETHPRGQEGVGILLRPFTESGKPVNPRTMSCWTLNQKPMPAWVIPALAEVWPAGFRVIVERMDERCPRSHTPLPLEVRIHRVGAEVGDVHRAMGAGTVRPEQREAIAREAEEAANELMALARDARGGGR
jgi:hypothetical protein